MSGGTAVAIFVILLVFGFVFLGAIYNYYLAKSKGFGPVGWCILGIIFPVISTIIVLALPDMRRNDKR